MLASKPAIQSGQQTPFPNMTDQKQGVQKHTKQKKVKKKLKSLLLV